MNDARNPTKDGEQDVDEQVAAAATLKEDTDRWYEEREDDFNDIPTIQTLSVQVRHDRGIAGNAGGHPKNR